MFSENTRQILETAIDGVALTVRSRFGLASDPSGPMDLDVVTARVIAWRITNSFQSMQHKPKSSVPWVVYRRIPRMWVPVVPADT